jgi:predicted ATP-dependent endonuclease of OLD family
VTEKYKQLSEDDKNYVKMIMKLDDHMSRIFFTKKVIVVEGDTEEIVSRKRFGGCLHSLEIRY